MNLRRLQEKLRGCLDRSELFNKVWPILKPVAPQIAIIFILIAYIFIGAAFFWQFGKPIEWRDRIDAQQILIVKLIAFERSMLNYTVAASSQAELDLNHTSSLVRQEVQQLYNLLVVHAKSIGVNKDLFGSYMDREWTLESAGVFAFSLITTIGSGILTPSTAAGRIFGLFYGIIGIPLAMLTIANTGKFMAEFLTGIYMLLRTEFRRLWAYLKRLRMRSRLNDSPTSDNLIEPVGSPNGRQLDAADLGETDTKRVTLQLMLGAFFTYMVVGAALMPQFKSTDFLSSCFLCFVSITTVGTSGETTSIWSTLCYLTFGLALTTVAIEAAGNYLQKLHHMARKLTNAKAVLINFGGKTITVGEMIWAMGQQYGVDESQILAFAENLDNFVVTTIEEKKAGTLLTVKVVDDKFAFFPRTNSYIQHVEDDF